MCPSTLHLLGSPPQFPLLAHPLSITISPCLRCPSTLCPPLPSIPLPLLSPHSPLAPPPLLPPSTSFPFRSSLFASQPVDPLLYGHQLEETRQSNLKKSIPQLFAIPCRFLPNSHHPAPLLPQFLCVFLCRLLMASFLAPPPLPPSSILQALPLPIAPHTRSHPPCHSPALSSYAHHTAPSRHSAYPSLPADASHSLPGGQSPCPC